MFIRDGIKNILDKTKLRFCTPGHKGNLCKQDITETGDFPADLIEKAQQRVAQILGVKHIRFLTGGSSIGIKAALLETGQVQCDNLRTDKFQTDNFQNENCQGAILAAANSHQSVYEAAKLSGRTLFLLENEVKDGLKQPLTPQQVEKALKAYPEISTVVLQSPDYYGLVTSPETAQIVKNAGKTLFIDAAHGAHFLFRPDLFDTRIFAYADAFNLSAHKTLPAYTQTAYLAVNSDAMLASADRGLKLLGTTSPSYPFLAGLEYAAEYTLKNKGKYDALKVEIARLKAGIVCAENNDFTRVVIDAAAMGLGGEPLYSKLRQRGIIPEKHDERYVVFIITVCDSPRHIARLREELCRIKAGS